MSTQPMQLSAAAAWEAPYTLLMDLLPYDDKPFLPPLHPDVDQRAALSYADLRQLAAITNASLITLAAGSRVASSLR